MFKQYQEGDKTVYPIFYPVNYGQMKSINCFLYDDGETITLIDAGIPIHEYKEFLKETLKQYKFSIQDIDKILLTHHHEDHVGQVNELLKQKQVPVYAHYLALPRLYYDENYLNNKYEFLLKLYKEYGCFEMASQRFEKMKLTESNRDNLKIKADIIPLHDGEKVSHMQVIEVPGHSPDSIIFYNQSTKWQFSGDLVLENTSTNALIDFDDKMQLLPTVSQYEQSLMICKSLETEWIFPGHQNPFKNHKLEIEKKLNRIEQKEKRVIEAVKNGNHDTITIAKILYGKKLETQFSLVISEVIGYLEYAVGRGNLVKTMQNGTWYFEQK